MNSFKEKKKFLSGREVVYHCQLVVLYHKYGILKYNVEQQYQVGSLKLPPGTVTYGFYWLDRPYILYKWFDEDNSLLGNYFSLADSVSLSDKEIVWRDLIVDILVLPQGNIEILDEDELPVSLNEKLRTFIESSKVWVLQNHKPVIRETDQLLEEHIFKKLSDI